MNGKVSSLPFVAVDQIANLLSRNCSEWTLLGHLFELLNPVTTQSLVERIANHNVTIQEICFELLSELAENGIYFHVLVDALEKLGLLGLANKIAPIQSQVGAQWMQLLSSFEQRNQTNSNSHVIVFPNLDDIEISKKASKMKTELALLDTNNVVDPSDRSANLTIHWLETNTKDIRTTIALVNMHGKTDKAWPMFIRQFGKPPNISIVQFHEAAQNQIVIPQKLINPAFTTYLQSVDTFLIDSWQNKALGNCCATPESHAEISIENSLVSDANLQSFLQHLAPVEDKLFFKINAKDKPFMIDQIACFLQCWTASAPNINTSRTVIALMLFGEQHADKQIAIPTYENGHVILSRFSVDDLTVVVFATTVENYWRLWIDYETIKLSYKNQGWTLKSMTPVNKMVVDQLHQFEDVPTDLIDALSFFVDDVSKIDINLNDYIDIPLLNTTTRGTTFFRHVGSNSQKELAAKDIESALNKAWPKGDFNNKPEKLAALFNLANIIPSDKTHNGLNDAWNSARLQMNNISTLQKLSLNEAPISPWYGNWLWTVIKNSTSLTRIGVPQTKLIPNVLVIRALKQIPDHIILEFEFLDINVKTIIDSLTKKTIAIKTVAPGPFPLPDPKRNRITVECIELVDEDTSIVEDVLNTYSHSRPTVKLPEKLMNCTTALIDMCRQINNAPPGARASGPDSWLLPNFEIGLQPENADEFCKAYPLIPQPITVRSIINYFDNVKATNLDFTVDYVRISENAITLCVESVEAAVQLKKHLIVKEVKTGTLVRTDNIIVMQNKLVINCSAGKFYSIKRQISGFAPSPEIIVPTLNVKLLGKIYPDMSHPSKRQTFLENAKKLDAGNKIPLCYFCKAPVQDKFELINVVPWANVEWSSEEIVLPVHSHCNAARNKHLFTVVLQPKSFSFPLVVRTLAFEELIPAVLHYISASEDLLECKYDNLKCTTVLKMEELEYHMEDEGWRNVSEQLLGMLLTTNEYDIIDKSLVSINIVPLQTKFDGTYLGQDVVIKAIPAKDTTRELFWLKALKFPSIVQFFGYYYDNEHTTHLIFEKLKYDLSAIKLGDIKKEIRMRIVQQVCAALAFLHRKGMVYRSLKPGVILLDEQYKAKLMGINPLTELAEVGYSAPEVINNGDGSVSKASDVYAFGILLLELATTRNAWEGRSSKQITETIKNGWFPESLRNIDMNSDLYQLIAKCLDKEPAQRPSFAAIQTELRNDKLTANFA